VEALGHRKEQAHFIIMQVVRLFQNGKEVKMSKRSGNYITLDELIAEVGVDVARFFFLSRANNTHLNFNLDLAKQQSAQNPVYYIQYAHARICSILRKAGKKKFTVNNGDLLSHSSELALVKQLVKLPEIIKDTANDYQLQRLPQYSADLAGAFHRFYTDCRVIDEGNKKITELRLALVEATRIVLKNILDIIGVSAPETM